MESLLKITHPIRPVCVTEQTGKRRILTEQNTPACHSRHQNLSEDSISSLGIPMKLAHVSDETMLSQVRLMNPTYSNEEML